MKKIWFLCSILIFVSSTGFAQYPKLRESASISVLTMGPSQEELYSAFGHSAIRIYDSLSNLDVFFNYGVFNFNQPYFYLNFARGNLNYMVEVYNYTDYLNYYIEHKRFVHEQVLNLTASQKQKVSDFLFWNVRPENQYYPYDYFYNNCATKVRDVFTQVLDGEVFFDSLYIKSTYTIRNLTDLYLGQQPWGDLGIDICLGLPMDKKAKPFEYMFLPDYIESSFAHATNKVTATPLVKKTRTIYQPEKGKIPFHWFHPWIIFGIAFAIVVFVSWRDWQRKKLSKWLDVVLFFVVGVIGILLLFLWTLTDHHAAAKNFNLLWAVPTHAVIAIFLMRKFPPRWIKKYFLATAILTALLLGFWFVLPQALNVFLIPIAGIILMRSLLNFRQSD